MAVLDCFVFLPLTAIPLPLNSSRSWCSHLIACWVHCLSLQLLHMPIGYYKNNRSHAPILKQKCKRGWELDSGTTWRSEIILCQLRKILVIDISWGLEASPGLRTWRQCYCLLPNSVARSLLLCCQLDQKISGRSNKVSLDIRPLFIPRKSSTESSSVVLVPAPA